MTSRNAATMSTVPQYLACVADKLIPLYRGLGWSATQAKETRPSTHVAASPNPPVTRDCSGFITLQTRGMRSS